MENGNDRMILQKKLLRCPLDTSEKRDLHLDPITATEIVEIQNNLEIYEKVSIIYLLYDDPQIALDRVTLSLWGDNSNFLEEWVTHEKEDMNNKWQEKLLEALAVVQNYQILKRLRFSKEIVSKWLSPLDKTVPGFINHIRKCLYRIIEEFTNEKVETFLTRIKNNLEDIPIHHVNGNTYLEIYFLYFEMRNYISCGKPSTAVLENMIDICKSWELDHSEMLLQILFCLNNNNYHIDPSSPGTLIIINNEFFYSEFRSHLIDLLSSDDQLEPRKGTEQDKEILKSTFEQLNFKVVCFDNLNHEDILLNIQKEVDVIDKESSLFVAILSHGSQGTVYGANSIHVKVAEIENIMRSDVLTGKPKVLILQSCQGGECQNLNESDPFVVRDFTLKTDDMLVFWATVPGYSSIRDGKLGSWFIQTLCKKILEHRSSHFGNICVLVIRDVINMRWGQRVMVPLVESKFSKFLYISS